jgi:NADPH:quinone reductase-like Zn-dependent oxidoreductase
LETLSFRRARLNEYGPLAGIKIENAAMPSPGAGEVLIRVEAAAVNPVDWKLVMGYLRNAVPVPLPYTPGCDVAGEIVAIGEGLPGCKVGDRVFGYPSLMRGGAFAEYALLAEDEFALAPQTIPLREAALYPVAAVTAYEGLFEFGQLKAGERLLVLGGAGAIGSLAVQMGRLSGAEVFASTSPGNLEMVAALGAKTVDYTQPLRAQVADVDFVLDTVGGQARLDALPTLKRGGRIITPVWPAPDASLLEPLGVLGAAYGIIPNRAHLDTIRPWIDEGHLRMNIDEVFELSRVVQALEKNSLGRTRGKILVAMSE